jgi:ketosteroid isomerase-like protein
MLRALEQKDLEGFLSFLADDVEMYAEDDEQPVRGKELLRRLYQGALPAMDAVKLELRELVQDARHEAVLADTWVRFGQDLPLPDGSSLPLAGKALSGRVALFLNLDANGKVTCVYRMRDRLNALRQLGISPAELERLRSSLEPMLHAH